MELAPIHGPAAERCPRRGGCSTRIGRAKLDSFEWFEMNQAEVNRVEMSQGTDQ